MNIRAYMVQQNPMGLSQYNHAPKCWHMEWLWNCNVLFCSLLFYFLKEKKQTIFFMFLCRVTFWSLHCSTLRTLTWRRLARIMVFISFQMITYVLSHSLCGFFLVRPREKTIDNYSCEHQGSDSSWWHLRWVLLICKIFIVGLKSNKFINHI